MPKSKEQYSEIKENRKACIINAGLKVFCEKGYDYATVDDIVKRSGCSHGLFYHYFKSKKEIFDEVVQLHREHRLISVNEEVEKARTCRDKLRITIEKIYKDLQSDEIAPYCFYFFVSQCFSKKEKGCPPPPKPPNGEKPPVVFLESFFEEGQKNGEVTKKYTPSECTSLFLSIITGATLSYVIAPKEAARRINLPNIDFIIDTFCIGD